MTVYVNVRDYVFSHGRMPRGYGSWAFFFDQRGDVGTAFFFHGSYAEAKKAAKAEAKRQGCNEVFVGS